MYKQIACTNVTAIIIIIIIIIIRSAANFKSNTTRM